MILMLHTQLLNHKGKMADGYNDFVESLKGNKKLADLWNEFDESLIKNITDLLCSLFD